jgi:hypothetical protein
VNIDWHRLLDRVHLIVGLILYIALQLLGLAALIGFGFLVVLAAVTWL